MAKARRSRRRSTTRARSDGRDDEPRLEHWRADGQAKTRFASADEANRASLRLRLDNGADLDPYPCQFCGGWHLGNRRT